MYKTAVLCAALVNGLLAAHAAAPILSKLEEPIRVIRLVGPEGRGNAEASKAWAHLSTANGDALPTILAGMNGAHELALNWLDSAVDVVVGREIARSNSLPLAALGEFLFNTQHEPRPRWLAFDLIRRADPAAASRILPGLLNDPGLDLRREAVEVFINHAKQARDAGNRSGATLLYQQALNAARDAEQIDRVAVSLRELGHSVDLVRQFGFLTHWQAVGPFDNTAGKGFNQVFPPEEKLDLAAQYDGKLGKVGWKPVAGNHTNGIVDMNPVLGKLKEVTGFATTVFHSETAGPAELRLGCKNGWKVWFNGKFLFGRDEYHRAAEIDQYRLPVQLRAGPNTILVKVCQNEQVEDWTVEWEFQLRVTDSLGTPIRPTTTTTHHP